MATGAGTSLRLEDVSVRDTAPRASDLSFGRGLGVQDGAMAQVSRALFERNRQVTIMVVGLDASARLEDVVVTDTLVAECGAGCASGAGDFVVTRAALCGVQLAFGGELDLSNGGVRESAIGACVQVPGYRLSRLNASVIYVDNGANLEATDFPVPEVSEPVGAL